MDSESPGASTGKHSSSHAEQPSDEDDSRLPPHKRLRNEKAPDNEDSEESNVSEDADIYSGPKKQNVGVRSLTKWTKTKNHPHTNNHLLQKNRHTQKKNHTQYSGNKTMPGNTKNKNKRHQGNNNMFKHDRQSTKTTKKNAVRVQNLPQTLTSKSTRRMLCMKIRMLQRQQILRYLNVSCVRPSTTLAQPLSTKKQ